MEELNVQAMLLGMWYDPADHTFNDHTHNLSMLTSRRELDADTLEPTDETAGAYANRTDMVSSGQLGAKDYDPTDET